MANSRITKEIFAKTLKNLMKDHSLAKISVKDITEHCGLSRNSFYYHFKDKYELINWIFYEDMLRNANSFDDPLKLADSFINICKCVSQNRMFYLACFQYVGQNSLFETIHELYCELWKMNLNIRYAETGIQLPENEIELMAKLNAYALVGIISEWVKGGMSNNYMSYLEQVKDLLNMEYFTLDSINSDSKKRVNIAS